MSKLLGDNFNNLDGKAEYNQYWYSANTVVALLGEVRHHAMSCAFLSTPSLFFALDHRNGDEDDATDEELRRLRSKSKLFEFDSQWESDPGYVKYDFHYPERIPIQYMSAFDYVVADPPFITADVWEAYMTTTKLILKEGGKVLFTTTLENHAVLEELWRGPLFIARFFPLVRNLTYQYVCFTSYGATRLSAMNGELSPGAPKLLAAIEMANSLRESEEAFAAQMTERSREGEQPLPTTAYERELGGVKTTLGAPLRAGLTPEQLAQMPIKDLEWNYVPEGLSMYPEGQTSALEHNELGSIKSGGDATNGCAALEEPQDYGPIYTLCVDLRQNLEAFKSEIDALQRLLDLQVRLRHQRMRVRKELAELTAADPQQDDEGNQPVGDTKPSATGELEGTLQILDVQVQEAEAERQAKVDHMEALTSTIVAQEVKLHDLKTQDDARAMAGLVGGSASTPVNSDGEAAFRVAYEPVLQACIAAYRTVAVKKAPLQELASTATGRYKYPLFSRMQELLRELKVLKKQMRDGLRA